VQRLEFFYCLQDFRSGAEGIRTPDLRRAMAATYFAGAFCGLQKPRKIADFYASAFPELSGE
jgi:hypothetical protein